MSLSPAPMILKIVFVIVGRSYGKVCLLLFGKQNPYTVLNLAARNSSNNIHSAPMEIYVLFNKYHNAL